GSNCVMLSFLRSPHPNRNYRIRKNALRLPIKRGTSRSSPLARILPSPEESLVTLRELPLDLRSTLGAIILVFARRFFAERRPRRQQAQDAGNRGCLRVRHRLLRIVPLGATE